MSYSVLGRLHAELTHTLSTLRRDQSGQGTVEYIALIVLMGGVFAVVAGVAGKGGDLGVGTAIKEQLADAIKGVTTDE